MLVFDLANNLFEDVLKRQQTLQCAVLINHQSKVSAAFQELCELIFYAGGLRHEPGLANNAGHIDRLDLAVCIGDGLQEVLVVQYADDVFGFFAVERQTAVTTGQRFGQDVSWAEVCINGGDLLAMDHHFANVHFRQIQDPAQHPTVAGFHEAFGVVVFHGAANLLVRGQDVQLHIQAKSAQDEGFSNHELDGEDDRSKDPDHQQRGS